MGKRIAILALAITSAACGQCECWVSNSYRVFTVQQPNCGELQKAVLVECDRERQCYIREHDSCPYLYQ